MREMQDSELIQAVRAGDREAFGRLVERYQAAIYRLCHGVTGNAPDAEELAHDAFVEAYLKLHQLRDPEKFAPWLKRLALNLCPGALWADGIASAVGKQSR
jgi:RNA polymerase sigma-70 factor, ECF subfamily